MKILYYSPHPYLNLASPSGPGTHMREIIKSFRTQGHEVSVCIVGGEHIYGDIRFYYSKRGIKALVKKLMPAILWQTIKDINLLRLDRRSGKLLRQAISDFQPDLIYERGFYMMCSGVKIAREKGIPHITEMNAPFLQEKESLEGKTLAIPLAAKREKIQSANTDMMVVVSSVLKEYYEGNHPALKGRVLITPNAIDPENFITKEEVVQSVRRKLKLKDAIVIGFVGSIFPYHGVHHLLRAFGEYCDLEPEKNIRLLIVGDGETMPELRRSIADKAWVNKVIFTGNVPHDEVRNYMANMDITVLANSNYYGSPIKLFEYGAMNKAIISIKNQAVMDAMIDGEDGLLIPDPEKDLLPALQQMIANPELRIRLAASFHEKVHHKFTWHATGVAILDRYKELASKKF